MKQSVFIQDIQVANQLGVSRATIWRWVKLGYFPKPVKLSAGCTRWRIEDVDNWAESRAEVA